MESNHIRAPSPAGREPPAALLRQLRAVDPTLDCHYLGRGRWVVGAHRPNSQRRQLAGNKMETLARAPDAVSPAKAQMAVLAYDGLAPIDLYEFRGPGSWGHVVHDIRRRDWLFRHRAEAEFDAALESGSTMGRPGADADEYEARIKSAFPYLFKGRKHFTQPGV